MSDVFEVRLVYSRGRGVFFILVLSFGVFVIRGIRFLCVDFYFFYLVGVRCLYRV